MNIYVANIPFKSPEKELKELFERYGEVSSAKIILDKETTKPRLWLYRHA
jgi:RNA recognition motif-containing protein